MLFKFFYLCHLGNFWNLGMNKLVGLQTNKIQLITVSFNFKMFRNNQSNPTI